MDISITSAAAPASPTSRRGLRALWVAYERRMAYGQPLVGVRAWPFLDWRTASGLHWRTQLTRQGEL
jgi:hypothetical protein